MFKPLHILLDRIVRRGTLVIETADGTAVSFGDGRLPRVAIKLLDPRLERQIPTSPSAKPTWTAGS
jgi:hypothetical protein